MHRVDLNCDMGESFGSYKMGHDEEILDLYHISQYCLWIPCR